MKNFLLKRKSYYFLLLVLREKKLDLRLQNKISIFIIALSLFLTISRVSLSKDENLPIFIHHFRYEKFDQIAQKASSPPSIEILGILAYCPTWGSSYKQAHANWHPPALLDKTQNYKENENNPNIWANFVYNTVKRYKAFGIKYWEIWNEPNVHFWGEYIPEQERVDKYVQLLKVSYKAAKEANPDCKILIGGVANDPPTLNFYAKVLDKIREQPVQEEGLFSNIFGSGNKAYGYFDIISIHIYSDGEEKKKQYEQLRDDIFRDFKLDIWITETGIDAFDPDQEDMQNDYLIRTEKLFKNYPEVKKIFWYNLIDNDEGKGLIYSNENKKKAFDTFKTYTTDGKYGICSSLNGTDDKKIGDLFDKMHELG